MSVEAIIIVVLSCRLKLARLSDNCKPPGGASQLLTNGMTKCGVEVDLSSWLLYQLTVNWTVSRCENWVLEICYVPMNGWTNILW